MMMRTNVVIALVAFQDVDHRGRCMEDMGNCEALGEATGLRIEPLCPSEQAQRDIVLAFINASIGPLQTPPPLFLYLAPSSSLQYSPQCPYSSHKLQNSLCICVCSFLYLCLCLCLYTHRHTRIVCDITVRPVSPMF